jgi:hypothetical protein
VVKRPQHAVSGRVSVLAARPCTFWRYRSMSAGSTASASALLASRAAICCSSSSKSTSMARTSGSGEKVSLACGRCVGVRERIRLLAAPPHGPGRACHRRGRGPGWRAAAGPPASPRSPRPLRPASLAASGRRRQLGQAAPWRPRGAAGSHDPAGRWLDLPVARGPAAAAAASSAALPVVVLRPRRPRAASLAPPMPPPCASWPTATQECRPPSVPTQAITVP